MENVEETEKGGEKEGGRERMRIKKPLAPEFTTVCLNALKLPVICLVKRILDYTSNSVPSSEKSGVNNSQRRGFVCYSK